MAFSLVMRKHPGGTISDIKLHLVFVAKYRYQVFTNEILNRLKVVFRDLCDKWECDLIEFNGELDHVHVLIEVNPVTQISKLSNNFKTVSSRYIRKEYPTVSASFEKDVLWKIGYFVGSAGSTDLEQIRAYIENRSRPES